jgi:ABC-type amino acid transport substrate-binding protein
VKTSRHILLALVLALTVLAAACGGDGGDDQEPTGDGEATSADGGDAPADLGLQQEGLLVVGSDIAFEPFEFIQDGEPAGFDIDLMNEIASRLGVEVEYVNASFDTIFTQLASGDFDAIISAITITEERQQTIAFTDPYFAANQALAVSEGSDIASVDDLAGKQLAAQANTTGLDYANENFTDATIVEFPTSEAAFTALRSGQVDAVFIDLPVVGQQEASSEGEVVLAEEVDTGELYGIGLQQDNEGLAAAINEQLAAIIEDGTYEQFYSEWFEGDVPEQFRQ